MNETTPQVVTRYLAAAEARDSQALAACFTEDGTVLDEGTTFRGRDEIVGWREGAVSQWTYTTTITGPEPVSENEYRAFAHIEGDFPGGVVDLVYDFVLAGDLIADLRIG